METNFQNLKVNFPSSILVECSTKADNIDDAEHSIVIDIEIANDIIGYVAVFVALPGRKHAHCQHFCLQKRHLSEISKFVVMTLQPLVNNYCIKWLSNTGDESLSKFEN